MWFAGEVYEEHMENAADLSGFDLPEAQWDRLIVRPLNTVFQKV